MTKQEVIAPIQSLPDHMTIDEILCRLYVRAAIEAGLDDLDAGLTVSHEEVKRMVERKLFETRREFAPDA